MPFNTTETVLVNQQDHALTITFNRPESRNAMNSKMVDELIALFEHLPQQPEIRAVVLRGAGGHFCAGGDIKDMAAARAETNGIFKLNRHYGHMLQIANRIPAVMICVLEGAVMGGGFGLACVSDVAIIGETAQFALPETSLGILPAQIAPFVVQRVGLTQTRRLALTGGKLTAHQAYEIGLGHYLETGENIENRLHELLKQIKRCAPGANAKTKQLMFDTLTVPLDQLLDQAARDFANAVTGAEGIEGSTAFVQKRSPSWAQ